MQHFGILFSLFLPYVGAFPDRRLEPRQSSIEFQPCYSSDSLECGRYEPPLDYSNTAGGKASLAIIRYKAKRQPRLGTIFTNPGGPGTSGVDFIVRSGEILSNTTGGYYDIVSWDPRGVNHSFPRISCFSSGAEEAAFWGTAVPWTGIETRGNFTFAPDFDALYGKVNDTDLKLRQFGERCTLLSGNNLTFVGTVATVRDMVGMADLLEGAGSMINYWGFSYGTMLGSYFINMFPNRVGRVVFDGVQDPIAYSANPPHKARAGELVSADETFDAFGVQCAAAGSSRCALNDGTNFAPGIKGYVWGLIDATYDAHKLGFPYGAQTMRDYIFSYMYSPRYWDELASQLRLIAIDLQNFATALTGANPPAPPPATPGAAAPTMPPNPQPDRAKDYQSSTKDFVQQRVDLWQSNSMSRPLPVPWDRRATANVKKSHFQKRAVGSDGDAIWEMQMEKRRVEHLKRQQAGQPRDYSIVAITCGDAIDAGAVTTRDVFDEILRTTHDVSPMFGASWSSAGFWCHRWPARSVERYPGPFNNTKLSNKILIIGNEFDPITPFANTRALSDALGDSAIMIGQDDWGHTSGSLHSECTVTTVSNYFIGGIVPPNDLFCPTNQAIFSGQEPSGVNLITTVAPSAPPSGTANQGATTTGTVLSGTELSSGSQTRFVPHQFLLRLCWLALAGWYLYI